MTASVSDEVRMVEEAVFAASADVNAFLPPSPYDAAWVAMVARPDDDDDDDDEPDPGLRRRRPMFPQCVDWLLGNQRAEAFWGEPGGGPAAESLTATLACVVALGEWKTGRENVEKGLAYLHTNTEKVLIQQQQQGAGIPRWFAIVFPGMLELAQSKGLNLHLPPACSQPLDKIFEARSAILATAGGKEAEDGGTEWHPPLTMYLEALPASHRPKDREEIIGQLMADGSLFRSPSATACAFMLTRDESCLQYLRTMLKCCRNTVPCVFPADQDLMKLCLVDHLRRLGCAEHFDGEIRAVMDQTYRSWVKKQDQKEESKKYEQPQLMYKDSLAFYLLRAYGYGVSPRNFCRFMEEDEIVINILGNCTEFMGAMYGIYRAAYLMFPKEVDLHNAKELAVKVLHKCLPDCIDLAGNFDDMLLTDSQKEIAHELKSPWLTRFDHLEHREYLERNKGYIVWMGKTNTCRISSSPQFVLQLAAKSFRNRQSIYRNELEKLKRWSEESAVFKMGFGREKTAYCYFLATAPTTLPLHCDLRKIVAKSAVLVTIVDDFFDEKGSLQELEELTKAIQIWEGESLVGHSRVIFEALDDLVREVASAALSQHGNDVRKALQDLWCDVLDSWLKESNWSRSKLPPSIDEYFEVAQISVAIQTMTLPACYVVSPKLPPSENSSSRYCRMTKLAMLCARLLNDTQSYQREMKDGKLNMVPLYVKENAETSFEAAIEHMREILEKKGREFVELFLGDGWGDVPRVWKELHLGTLKGFWMIYNSTNKFDSPTALLNNIRMAFYEPLLIDT